MKIVFLHNSRNVFNGDFAIKMFVNYNEIIMISQSCSNLDVFDGVFTESPNFKIKKILLII